MSNIYDEATFESAIVDVLKTKGGYEEGIPDDFDRTECFDKNRIFKFLQTSQPKNWEKSLKIHGNNIEKNIISCINKEINYRGMLDIIRNGFTDLGVKYKLAYFKPETSLNPETILLYEKNILSVIRQVKYTTKNNNSLDIVLSINGLPVATVELKNQMTGQNVDNAKNQFKFDRDPRDLMFEFKKRALVHFVVDTDEAYFTTQLAGYKTKFFPFNLGNNNGKGNPENPNGYRTSYLWEYIWSKDSWMDIIGKFMHLQIDEKKKTETMIFPRYHQLDVVRKISEDVKRKGTGYNYLIQHSAGSGKSNSIAWLSYRLASLHNEKDESIFDSVIVITDRRVLDSQLQNTIYQFEHKQGVVKKIDKDSQQLAESIYHGSNIIISTLQKFPYVLEKIAEMEKEKGDRKKRTYAVIVDEAHSSQGGESSKKLKEVLAAKSLEEALIEEENINITDDYEEQIIKSMQARGRQPNLSFFGFTATPKAKTLEVFGIRDDSVEDAKPHPFHLYSMKQAIEEGFIHDVLKGYTTYQVFFKLTKAIEDDPNIDKKKAKRAIARFLTLHPYNISQKVQIIVEHFREIVSKKIGGKAKAMVVTGSRLHALRYYFEMKHYIKENKYNDINILVAFSGIVTDQGKDYRESEINGFGEKELPKKFETDSFQILIVADKYQTGFDQPLLHTMYVDKKLYDVAAVQTLSRLNRICSGKEDTFVLDFYNSNEEIKEAFQPYFEGTTVDENADPNHLYKIKFNIENTGIIWQSEVDNFAKVFFKPDYNPKYQSKLNAYLDPAVERFKKLPEQSEEDELNQDDFKHLLVSFSRMYAFLSQIMPFGDFELEKYYPYVRFLIRKLPKKYMSDRFNLDDEIALEYYRIKNQGKLDIQLEIGDGEVSNVKDGGGFSNKKEEKAPLSEIIQTINDLFGTDFKESDRLIFEQVVQDCVNDEELKEFAEQNTIDNFKYPFKDSYDEKWFKRMEQNKELFNRAMADDNVGVKIFNIILAEVYKRLTIAKENV